MTGVDDTVELATQGAPSVTLLVEHDGKVEFQTQRVQAEVYGAEQRALAFSETVDAVALVAWLHRDALIAALDKEIVSEADDKAALSHTDRELRTSEAMSDLLAVERTEAALVWRAMDEKLPVEFRADINPQALLGVALVTKPNGHLEPTSPGTPTISSVPVGGGGNCRSRSRVPSAPRQREGGAGPCPVEQLGLAPPHITNRNADGCLPASTGVA